MMVSTKSNGGLEDAYKGGESGCDWLGGIILSKGWITYTNDVDGNSWKNMF